MAHQDEQLRHKDAKSKAKEITAQVKDTGWLQSQVICHVWPPVDTPSTTNKLKLHLYSHRTPYHPHWPVNRTKWLEQSKRNRTWFTNVVTSRLGWTDFDQAPAGSNSSSRSWDRAPNSSYFKKSPRATSSMGSVPKQFIYACHVQIHVQIRV